MPGRNSKNKTITRSFRISESSLKALEEEAKRQNVGVSTLLNQQLLAFADFDRYFRRLGLVKMSSATFQRILRACPDNGLVQAGSEAGSDIPRSIIAAKGGSLDINSVIEHLTMMSEYSGQFEFGDQMNDGKRMITILHRLGPKGSKFFSSYMKALFEALGYAPKITSGETSVLVEFSQGNQATSS